jgi:Ankyrin repeats (3 copies)
MPQTSGDEFRSTTRCWTGQSRTSPITTASTLCGSLLTSVRDWLHNAARCWGDPQLVHVLLQARPDSARVKDSNGYLPLHLAVGKWVRVAKARVLVEHWPESIREQTNEGFLPLHEAAHAGSLRQLLLRDVAQAVSEPSNRGWLPLHSALSCNKPEQSKLAMAEFLLGHDPASILHATRKGYLPIHVALGRDAGAPLSHEDQIREAFLDLTRQVPSTPPAKIELIKFLFRRAPNTVCQGRWVRPIQAQAV